MTNRPWWALVLQWTAWLIAMMVVAAWPARMRRAAAPSKTTLGEALTARVPSLTMDEETAQMLANAREGRLPNVL